MVNLTDRERILLHIIRSLYSGSLLTRRGARFGTCERSELGAGDLVLGLTASMLDYHRWSISEIVAPLSGALGGYLVRDIVTGETCEYSNEMFVRIDGLDRTNDVFLCGARRTLHRKVMAAFKRGGSYEYRYGGLNFDGPHDARIVIRCVFGGVKVNEVAQPFEVPIHFTSRTSVAAILRTMIKGGYGTHQWIYTPLER